MMLKDFFWAFFHELLGPIFEEQAFHHASPKVIQEYSKNCDPDLQFQHYRGVNEQYNPGRFPSFNPTLRAVEILHCESISKKTDSGKCVANPTVRMNLYATTTTTTFIFAIIITIITISTIHILTPTPHISHISLTPSSNRYHHIMNIHFQTPCISNVVHYYSLTIHVQIPTLPLPSQPLPSMISTATQT